MTLIRYFIQLLLVLLMAAFGPVAGVAAHGDWQQVRYSVEAQDLDPQLVNLTNTPRAPPTTRANLMSTGAAFAQTGDLRALYDAETTGAVYALLQSSIATNRTGRNGSTAGSILPPTGIYPNKGLLCSRPTSQLPLPACPFPW